MSLKVCILQIWLFVCIKLILRVNTFNKVTIRFTFKYIFICINLDLIFHNDSSVFPVYGAKWI